MRCRAGDSRLGWAWCSAPGRGRHSTGLTCEGRSAWSRPDTESRLGRICVGLLAHRAHGLESPQTPPELRSTGGVRRCSRRGMVAPSCGRSVRCQVAVSHPAAATWSSPARGIAPSSSCTRPGWSAPAGPPSFPPGPASPRHARGRARRSGGPHSALSSRWALRVSHSKGRPPQRRSPCAVPRSRRRHR
jgi:hypothetical protein